MSSPEQNPARQPASEIARSRWPAADPFSAPPSSADLAELDEAAVANLDRLARALHVPNAELQPTLDAVVRSAVDTVEAADYAGLILLVRGELEPQATLGEPPHTLDMLQRELGTGPCLDAARQQAEIVITDMQTEDRWPDVVPTAEKLGIGSMVCVPLWVEQHRVGTLSLYSRQIDAYAARDIRLVRLFATLAALALADATRTTQLKQALVNRDVIGQAKGILMERHRITSTMAFDLLIGASQTTNEKLADVARVFVTTGALPGS
ncbi:GAF and ANTAR domain-containing protein [Jatrophihabitans telluris]|uniref:GAF and ANTAR domain-containing protein n=1 Tax=Jatrophihabitans telluris TaxID=2038343 RepID=A0ABY4QZK9_9ACTN|nr:GAF and ANTAR domain-containing protein [Jatrophihabitans telluris]UQX88431.1 GAF and ANTAR domain-containing protein [Jatrophihabitans telluris]